MTVLIFICVLMSTWHVYVRMFGFEGTKKRYTRLNLIMETGYLIPYQYRILKPVLLTYLKKLIPVRELHKTLIASILMAIVVFYGLYSVYFKYILETTSPIYAVVACLVLVVLIPVSITAKWQFGDFINLFLWSAGLYAIRHGMVGLLTFICVVGVANREQILYLLVFFVYDVSTLVSVYQALAIGAVGVGIYFLIRTIPARYYDTSIKKHLRNNTDKGILFNVTIPLWFSYVIPFFVLGFIYGNTITVLLLIPYTIAFFLRGNIYELAKFLPAQLILTSEILNGYFSGTC